MQAGPSMIKAGAAISKVPVFVKIEIAESIPNVKNEIASLRSR
jgi:hypothetical protein